MITDFNDELTYNASLDPTSKQSIVGNFGTAIIGGRVKDAGAGYTRDWGAGECAEAYVQMRTAVAGASGGVQFDIVAADDAGLVTNPVVLATRTIPAASLVLSSIHSIGRLAAGSQKRRLGCKITPLGSNTTTGEAIVGLIPPGTRPQDGANFL